MDRRRVAGVGVLAAAVIALSVGTGLSRPLTVGTASAPPVAPPPQVGDCLYAGPDGPWDWGRGDGSGDQSWELVGYNRWYAACRDPWFAQVVGVRAQADVAREAAEAGPGGSDPCAAATASYLGRPEVPRVDGWYPVSASGAGLDPDRRQLLSGQRWTACVLGPPWWDPDGHMVDDPGTGPRTTETLRGRWDDPALRDRVGSCESGPLDLSVGTFCGGPHDRELLAWSTWPQPTDATTLIEGCAAQAARLMRRDTVAGGLTTEVVLFGPTQPEIATAQTPLTDVGGANCVVRATDPAAQLTATVVGLGDRPDPITGG